MGVYIKGMEMPKEGNWKTVRIYPDGTCAVPNWQGDCTLLPAAAVPVPPHGRLIEDSKVLDIMSEWCPDEMLDEIEAIPTIIPAEQAEEGERWQE